MNRKIWIRAGLVLCLVFTGQVALLPLLEPTINAVASGGDNHE